MSMAAGARRTGARLLLQLRSPAPSLALSQAQVLPGQSSAPRGFVSADINGLPRGLLVRGFAGKAEAKQEHVQIPITLYGVTGKYASALYVSAVRGKALEPVETELQNIISTAESNAVFSEFLKDPSVSKNVRMRAIQDIFGKESSYSNITKNFLAVLAENGRLKELHKISNAYSELVLAHKGEVKATVTSALELTQEELNGIKDALKGHIKPGQVLSVEQKVDRSIIGGVVIDILDKHIDMSIDTRIKQMEKVLAENFY